METEVEFLLPDSRRRGRHGEPVSRWCGSGNRLEAVQIEFGLRQPLKRFVRRQQPATYVILPHLKTNFLKKMKSLQFLIYYENILKMHFKREFLSFLNLTIFCHFDRFSFISTGSTERMVSGILRQTAISADPVSGRFRAAVKYRNWPAATAARIQSVERLRRFFTVRIPFVLTGCAFQKRTAQNRTQVQRLLEIEIKNNIFPKKNFFWKISRTHYKSIYFLN